MLLTKSRREARDSSKVLSICVSLRVILFQRAALIIGIVASNPKFQVLSVPILKVCEFILTVCNSMVRCYAPLKSIAGNKLANTSFLE